MSSRSASFGRLATSACILILTAACSSLPRAEVEGPSGRTFIPTVPDSIDDVGLGSSITVDSQGRPYVSYLGFVGQLEEGEIPVSRPVGSPFLRTEAGDDAAAVLLASLSADQIWSRGAVAQPQETPSGVTVPFGPAAEPSLRSLTPQNASGTDVAVDGSDIHVTWTADTGVWYGLGPEFEVGPVEETPEAGTPSIAVDGAGTPLVAFTLAGTRPEVRLAERVGERWEITTVTTLSACGADCPPATQLAMAGDEPLVVVADPQSGELIAARREGAGWSTEVVATGVTGGPSLATAGDTAVIAFYTESGISVATGGFGAWSTEEVAPVRPAEDTTPSPTPSGTASPSPAPEPIETDPTTGVALDEAGTAWVTWEDRDGIHLASAAQGDRFEEVELSHVEGGVTPSVAVSEDGSSVHLSWLDPVAADLRVGIYAETEGILIAAPSPTAPPPTADLEDCGEDGEPVLDLVAQGQAFNPQCLVAPVAEPFTITFDNQDDVTATGAHNVVIAEDQESVADPIFRSQDVEGPATVPVDVPAIPEAGDYFFVCTFHPSTMTGALAVVESGGGGGGAGGGGGG